VRKVYCAHASFGKLWSTSCDKLLFLPNGISFPFPYHYRLAILNMETAPPICSFPIPVLRVYPYQSAPFLRSGQITLLCRNQKTPKFFIHVQSRYSHGTCTSHGSICDLIATLAPTPVSVAETSPNPDAPYEHLSMLTTSYQNAHVLVSSFSFLSDIYFHSRPHFFNHTPNFTLAYHHHHNLSTSFVPFPSRFFLLPYQSPKHLPSSQ